MSYHVSDLAINNSSAVESDEKLVNLMARRTKAFPF